MPRILSLESENVFIGVRRVRAKSRRTVDRIRCVCARSTDNTHRAVIIIIIRTACTENF